jgi:hypothetical protein
MPLLFTDTARTRDLASRFARAARFALAGLLLPPALLALASLFGAPLRSGVEALTWILALAGFAAAGWMAGLGLPPRPGSSLQTAAAFAAGGALVTPAFHALQGLTGKEPFALVAGFTLAGFGLGFGLAGAASAAIAGIVRSGLARAAVASTASGCLGGLIALLPWAWSVLRLQVVGGDYARMALAVVAFLGCVIVPFRLIGAFLDRLLPEPEPGAP